jgi:hypothetical protein
VASVNFTVPAASSALFESVTADFGSLVALDANQTYMLAFCATGGGNTQYSMNAINSGDTFRFCSAGDYDSCSNSDSNWEVYLGRSMRTNVIGSCTAASPASQLAPWGALAHIASLLLTALSHY